MLKNKAAQVHMAAKAQIVAIHVSPLVIRFIYSIYMTRLNSLLFSLSAPTVDICCLNEMRYYIRENPIVQEGTWLRDQYLGD